MTKTIRTTQDSQGNFQVFRREGDSITVELCVPSTGACRTRVLISETFEKGDDLYSTSLRAMESLVAAQYNQS